jgi:hypothetical protein
MVSLSSVILIECDAVYKNNPHKTEELQKLMSVAVMSDIDRTSAAAARNRNNTSNLCLLGCCDF